MNAATATTNANVSPDQAGYWTAFRRMPVVLQAYAGFQCIAVAAWIAGFVILSWPTVNRHVKPYGDVTTFNPYLFTIYFIFALPKFPPRWWLVITLPVMVSIGLWQGLAEMARGMSDANVTQAALSPNWFLRYEPARVLPSIVLPLFWVLMLISPEVWRWTSKRNVATRSRLSVIDLLYFMSVCAVCTAVAIGLMSHVRQRLAAGQVAAASKSTSVGSSPSPSFNSLPKPAPP